MTCTSPDCVMPCLVHCIYCGADCDVPWQPLHDNTCPQVTGLYPADDGDSLCCRCGDELAHYVLVDADRDRHHEQWCVGCALLDAE